MQCRLILDDPDGEDDRDGARYLMGVGGDWWKSMTAVWDQWTTNHDMGIGRFRFVTSEWRGYNMISLPEDQVRENPPPIAGSTGVDRASDFSVQDFQLSQNYPNPFNPKTVIRYTLAENGPVLLQVLDITGRLVETLVNGIQTAGIQSIPFNGNDLKSGTYLYRLTTANHIEVKKMVLVQ